MHRKVKKISDAGFITIERKGRSIYLHPTERTQVDLDKSFDEMVRTIKSLYNKDVF